MFEKMMFKPCFVAFHSQTAVIDDDSLYLLYKFAHNTQETAATIPQ